MNDDSASLGTKIETNCSKPFRCKPTQPAVGPKSVPRDMDEHGAAAAGHARPGVVVDFDDQIVETVVPAQPIAWFIGRPAEGSVIAAVRRILAPGIVAADPTHRQQGPRPRQPIRPPPQADRAKTAARRAAIALALGCLDPAPAQRHLQRLDCPGPYNQPCERRPGREWMRMKRNEVRRIADPWIPNGPSAPVS